MGTWSTAAVFTGNHEDGYLGDSYTSAGIDQDDGCFTTGQATCAGLTLDNVSVETSFDIQDETEGYTAGLNLAAYTDSLIEFATVDVTDPDVTQ